MKQPGPRSSRTSSIHPLIAYAEVDRCRTYYGIVREMPVPQQHEPEQAVPIESEREGSRRGEVKPAS